MHAYKPDYYEWVQKTPDLLSLPYLPLLLGTDFLLPVEESTFSYMQYCALTGKKITAEIRVESLKADCTFYPKAYLYYNTEI